MANTFSQIHMQFVFAVEKRESLIQKQHKEELEKYITGIVKNKNAKMLAINCMPDHTHIFLGLRPHILVSELVTQIKVSSNKFINDKKWVQGKFGWQEGYGVFSYSYADIDKMVKYVLNQELHHKKVSFREEYLGILKELAIPFEEQYLFNFFD